MNHNPVLVARERPKICFNYVSYRSGKLIEPMHIYRKHVRLELPQIPKIDEINSFVRIKNEDCWVIPIFERHIQFAKRCMDRGKMTFLKNTETIFRGSGKTFWFTNIDESLLHVG